MVIIKNNSRRKPAEHIVNERAKPNVHTIYPALQNVKKLGMNFIQLMSK